MKILGAHSNTLRNWVKSDKIKYDKTKSGQKRYDVRELLCQGAIPTTIASCRVSSVKQ